MRVSKGTGVAGGGARVKRAVQREKLLWGSQAQMLSMALPAVLLLFVFNYLPMGGLVLAFKNFRVDLGLFGSKFVGFQNFAFFFKSSDTLRVIQNTLLYNFVFIFLNLVVCVSFAIMLSFILKKVMIQFYQTAMFLPYFLSWVVVAYMSLAFLDYKNGLLNSLFSMFGEMPVSWYSEARYWPAILIIANTWKTTGYSTLVYYASILSIDSELYDAAEIDGCNTRQTIWHIIMPMLRPTMVILTILAIGKIFRADFGLFFNLPQESGTLLRTTDVVDTYIYRTLIYTGDIGISAAVGLIQSMVGFVLVLTTNAIVKRVSNDNALF